MNELKRKEMKLEMTRGKNYVKISRPCGEKRDRQINGQEEGEEERRRPENSTIILSGRYKIILS
jgi:hypothetical protein